VSGETSSEVVACEMGIDNLEAQVAMPTSSFEPTFDSTLEALSKQVDAQRGILEMCRSLVVERESLFF
jgi:hypothetical protein